MSYPTLIKLLTLSKKIYVLRFCSVSKQITFLHILSVRLRALGWYCIFITHKFFFVFQLLASFDCESSHAAAMLDLRHRILPSCFLSEHPKEAGFCLWLLHPEPSARPTTRWSKFLVLFVLSWLLEWECCECLMERVWPKKFSYWTRLVFEILLVI